MTQTAAAYAEEVMRQREVFAQRAAEHGFARGLDEWWPHPILGSVCFVGYRTRNYKYPFLVKQWVSGKQFKLTPGSAMPGLHRGDVL